MADRNGSTLEFTYAQVAAGGGIFAGLNLVSQIRDGAGRLVQIDYAEACSPVIAGCETDKLTYKTQDGAAKSIRVIRKLLSNAYSSSVNLNTALFPEVCTASCPRWRAETR